MDRRSPVARTRGGLVARSSAWAGRKTGGASTDQYSEFARSRCRSGHRPEIHRRAALREHERGQGRRVSQRRHDGGIAQRAGPGARFARAGTKLQLRLQGQDRRQHLPQSGRATARGHGAGRQRAQGRRQTAHHRPAHQRGDGFHLWSQTYDREMKDILAVQTEVAQQVVQALQVKLGIEAARALAKAPTGNPEAHRLYLLGRYHFGRNTEASLTNAMQYFTQALQQDPKHALAYCGLADCYGWLGGILLSGKEAWAKEKELAQKALALDPNLADAHLSLGIALASAFDWNGGEQEMKRALELNPRLALAYDQLAWLQAMFGRFEEAIRNQQKAIELDPLSLMFNSDLGWRLNEARRYDEAMAQLRKTLELDPNFADAHFQLGWCLVYKGDTAGAIASFQKAKSLDPQPWRESALAYAYARAGDRARAEQLLRDLEDQAKQRYNSLAPRMFFHLGLGEKDKALDWLERCYDEQDGFCWSLKVLPLYDPVRTEPRFQALLKKVGLDP
ncbi:MAG: tetratricopeptide repeat protein [Acidobacteria bacterium]|nr:tetratricopeptide repeat protein [Acidobacteriota bacterium]